MKWSIGLGITSQCNMNCAFCYSKLKRNNDDLPLPKWKQFFKENHKKIGELNYGTGENTLDDSWYDLIDYIRTNFPSIKQALTTNGSLSFMIKKNKDYERIVKNSIDEIDISLDFGNAKKHNEFRKTQNAFNWAINTLKFCKDNNITATIVLMGIKETLEKENLKEIFEIAKKYNALVRINLYRPVNKSNGLVPPKLSTIISTFDWIYENHKMVSFSDPLFNSIFTKNDIKQDKSGISSMRILPNGNIFPSTYLINDDYKSYNISEDNVFSKVLNSKIFTEIRTVTVPKACESCKVKHKCKGGVIDRRLLWYNSLDEPDPYCPKRYNMDEQIREFTFSSKSFSSVHDGYLPTLFFKPKNNIKNYHLKNLKYIDENFLLKQKDIFIVNGEIHFSQKENGPYKKINCEGFIALPGLINGHFHLGETIYKGLKKYNSLKDYLVFTNKLSENLKDEKSHKIISKISLIESLKNGITTISAARGWDVAKNSKIRGILEYPLMKSNKLKSYYDNFNINSVNEKKSDLISTGIWIHSLNYIDKSILESLSKSSNYNHLTIHVSETKDQIENHMKKNNQTEIETLNEYELLSSKINLIHCAYLTDKDVDLISKNDASITVCPISSINLNSKYANISKLQKKGINICIGTDGLATSKTASLFRNAKQILNDFKDVQLKDIFNMITINPAKALGLEKVGKIKENFFADLALYKINIKRKDTAKNTFKKLIFENKKPKYVFINGKMIVKREKITTINEIDANNDYDKLKKKLGF